MKILRSVNRRAFTVEPAGYFNVLTPSKKFAPAHPPGQFHYLPGQSKGPPFLQTHVTTAPQFGSISRPDQKELGYRRLLRPAFIVLAAIALTLSLVWWSAGCPTHVIIWAPSQ